jgi:hypothetical protein
MVGCSAGADAAFCSVPIAEALKRLTGPRTYLLPPADSGRDRLFGRSLALPEALRETEGPPFWYRCIRKGQSLVKCST